MSNTEYRYQITQVPKSLQCLRTSPTWFVQKVNAYRMKKDLPLLPKCYGVSETDPRWSVSQRLNNKRALEKRAIERKIPGEGPVERVRRIARLKAKK
jgi:hypothetical protein